MELQKDGWIVVTVLVLFVFVLPMLGGSMMGWGVTGPWSCSYWPGP